MRPLVIVVPKELLQCSTASIEGKKWTTIQTFIIDCAKKTFNFAVAFGSIRTQQAVLNAQAMTELLKTSLPPTMKSMLHREHPSVIGHDGLHGVRETIQNPLQELGGGATGLLGGNPGDGLAGEIIDRSKFVVVTGIAQGRQELNIQVQQLPRALF